MDDGPDILAIWVVQTSIWTAYPRSQKKNQRTEAQNKLKNQVPWIGLQASKTHNFSQNHSTPR